MKSSQTELYKNGERKGSVQRQNKFEVNAREKSYLIFFTLISTVLLNSQLSVSSLERCLREKKVVLSVAILKVLKAILSNDQLIHATSLVVKRNNL